MNIDDTKSLILRVANRLFSRYGFHKTSMDEIAKSARRAKGSLYYHFASKEELFRNVLLVEITNLKNQLITIVNNPDLSASDKLQKYLITRMQILHGASSYHETLKADLFEHFHFIDDLRNELDNWEKENLKKIINQGVDSGEFNPIADIDVLLNVFILLIKGLEIPFFLQNKFTKYATHFEEFNRMLIKGLS